MIKSHLLYQLSYESTCFVQRLIICQLFRKNQVRNPKKNVFRGKNGSEVAEKVILDHLGLGLPGRRRRLPAR